MFDRIDVLALAGFLAVSFWGIDDESNGRLRRMFTEPEEPQIQIVMGQAARKAQLQPPAWVFGLVWPVLYALCGVSGFIFWKNEPGFWYLFGLGGYSAAKVLNRYWTTCFVSGHTTLSAWMIVLMEVFGGLYLTASCVLASGALAWVGAALYVPILVWQGFALYLNLQIVKRKYAVVSVEDI